MRGSGQTAHFILDSCFSAWARPEIRHSPGLLTYQRRHHSQRYLELNTALGRRATAAASRLATERVGRDFDWKRDGPIWHALAPGSLRPRSVDPN